MTISGFYTFYTFVNRTTGIPLWTGKKKKKKMTHRTLKVTSLIYKNTYPFT